MFHGARDICDSSADISAIGGWITVYSALLGLHGGIIRSAGCIVWINFFGRKHQGAIQGMSMSIMVLAAALGPVPPALAHDLSGSYEPAFVVVPCSSRTCRHSCPVSLTAEKQTFVHK